MRKNYIKETRFGRNSQWRVKNIVQIEHFRHRFFNNFIVNSFSVIAAYCFFEKKLAIDVCFVKDGQFVMF